MGAIPVDLITADELLGLSEAEQHLELVRGVLVAMPLPGAEHSVVVANAGVLLLGWAKASGAGAVGVRSGHILGRAPDTVRATDLAFVRAERLPGGRPPVGFYDLAHDFAREVVSPDDLDEAIQAKVLDYLDAGTGLVVLVYPGTRTLIAHFPDGLARIYREDEEFAAPAVLPGFSCQVAELFA